MTSSSSRAPARDPPRDSFGFLLEDDALDLAAKNQTVYNSHILPRQCKLWAEVAARPDLDGTLNAMRKAKSKRLKAMVRGGIPCELRARVWDSLAGAASKRNAMDDAGYYERLLVGIEQREREENVAGHDRNNSELIEQIEQIDKDLGRTFPGHSTMGTPEGQARLRRLLRAYCVGRNPRTGYCQGMNFLAAMLLLVMREEEPAFWMLVVMVERLLPADYYTDGLIGVRVDSGILLDMLKERLPTLHAHLDSIGVLPMLPIVTTQWFISLFVFWLPTETLLRLWDCFFFDGLKSKNKTFFRAALTLFKMNEKDLLEITDVQLLMDSLRSMSVLLFDADALIHQLYSKAWLSHFTLEAMQKKEVVHRLEVEGEAQKREAKKLARQKQQQKEAERKAAAVAAAAEQGGVGGSSGSPLGAKGSAVSSASLVRAASSESVESLREEDEEVTAAREEVMIARMQRLTMAFAAEDDEDEDDDLYPMMRPTDTRSRGASANATAATLVAAIGRGDAAAEAGGAQGRASYLEEPDWLKEAAEDLRTTSTDLGPVAASPSSLSLSMPPSPVSSVRGGPEPFVPKGYLLKRSPAKTFGLLQRFAWQRRWFEVSEDSFSWYASSEAAGTGQEPLGRVPRSMVLTALPSNDGSGFEVDLGNRVIKLTIDGVSKASLEHHVRNWVHALNDHQVLGDVQDESTTHKAKFWKVESKASMKTKDSSPR